MSEEKAAEVFEKEHEHDDHEEHHVPGTVVLTLALLVSFAVYYFANWKALADVWHVR
jgi:hypothetical protein